ncbi:autotransporter outer membrane beta-barrel domain-containing protein [Methylocella sp.]|uniref:autotransporter outer membrane beta-barrel domain-containing protein n=1 Tax=Methylocella sp. TaxID=1978226 RepID=UPI003784342E
MNGRITIGVAGAAALWFAGLGAAQAGSLCPASVSQTVTKSRLVCVQRDPSSGQCLRQETQFYQTQVTYTGVQLQNGLCTNNGRGDPDPAAFSGAALASQALSELSQSTTQETARSAENSIAGRREEETNRCAEGFRRVDGACEPVAPPAQEPAPPPPPKPAKAASKKSAKKAARAAPEPAAPAPRVSYARPAVVSKDGPVPPPPIEAPARYGVWANVFGGYERRDASAPGSVYGPDFNAGAPVGIETYVQSKTGTVGFQTGFDFTSRGLFAPTDGMIVGVLAGYLSSTLNLDTQTASSSPDVVGGSSTHLHASLQGATLGAYATYFNGPFSADLLAKFDLLSLDQNFNDNLAFGGPAGPFNVAFSGSGSTSLTVSTVTGNLNYRFTLQPNLWLEPTVGAQFTWLGYGGGAQALGLSDGNQIMVQGGARVGTSGVFENVKVATTLTGLAYSDVAVNGGFIAGAAANGNNILADADRGQVRGRGILAFNFDFGQGLTSFIAGDLYGGQGLFGAGGKAGLRYEW